MAREQAVTPDSPPGSRNAHGLGYVQHVREAHVGKLRIIGEYFQFLRQEGKWWLLPIAVILLLLGALIVFTQGSALAPFIYTLF